MQEAEKYSRYSFLLDKTARRVKQYAKQRFRELGWTITIARLVLVCNEDASTKHLQCLKGIN